MVQGANRRRALLPKSHDAIAPKLVRMRGNPEMENTSQNVTFIVLMRDDRGHHGPNFRPTQIATSSQMIPEDTSPLSPQPLSPQHPARRAAANDRSGSNGVVVIVNCSRQHPYLLTTTPFAEPQCGERRGNVVPQARAQYDAVLFIRNQYTGLNPNHSDA